MRARLRLREIRRLTLALLSVGPLAGCMVGPNYHAPDVATPAAFSEAGSTPRTSDAADEALLSRWWTRFDDPVLNHLIDAALADNPDLQASASRVREARQQVRIAAAAELPSLNASGDAIAYNSDRKSAASGAKTAASGLAGIPIPSHLGLYSAGFDSSWEIDLFGGVRRGVEAAKAGAQAAKWSRRDGQVSLLAEVANDYLSLRLLQARLAIGQAELARQRSLFDLIRARRASGFVTNLDVNQQTIQVAAAAAEIPQLEAQARAMTHALAVLVGQPPETFAVAAQAAGAEALPAQPPTLPLGLPLDLLRRRPDIREAERRVAQANADIGVREAALYPKLNLIGLASFAGTSLNGLFSNDNFATLGLGTISQPLFDAGKSRAAIAAAKEERIQAALAYRAAVLGALRDVEDALARYQSEQTRERSLAQSYQATDQSQLIAEDQFQAGLVNFANVLQSQNARLNARDQLLQSDGQALSDLVSLYKALGGGWSDGDELGAVAAN